MLLSALQKDQSRAYTDDRCLAAGTMGAWRRTPARTPKGGRNPLIIGAVILFGLMALGRLVAPAREQQVMIILEQPQASIRASGCGTLLLTGFLALLLFGGPAFGV